MRKKLKTKGKSGHQEGHDSYKATEPISHGRYLVESPFGLHYLQSVYFPSAALARQPPRFDHRLHARAPRWLSPTPPVVWHLPAARPEHSSSAATSLKIARFDGLLPDLSSFHFMAIRLGSVPSHVDGRLVLPLAQIDYVPEQTIWRPLCVTDLDDHFGTHPMDPTKHQR